MIRLGGGAPTVALICSLHGGSRVGALAWDEAGSTLFAGDAVGRVSASRVTKKNVFRSTTELLHQLDSGIVQLDVGPDLLVSTNTRSYILNPLRQTLAPSCL